MAVPRYTGFALLFVGVVLQFNGQYVSAGVFGVSPDPAAAAAAAVNHAPTGMPGVNMNGLPGNEMLQQIPGGNILQQGIIPGQQGIIPGQQGVMPAYGSSYGVPSQSSGFGSPMKMFSPMATMTRDMSVAGLDATEAGLSTGGRAFRTGSDAMMDAITSPLANTPIGGGIKAMRGFGNSAADMGGSLIMKPFGLGRSVSNKFAGFLGATPSAHEGNQFAPALGPGYQSGASQQFIPGMTQIIPGTSQMIPGASQIIPGASQIMPGNVQEIHQMIPGGTQIKQLVPV